MFKRCLMTVIVLGWSAAGALAADRPNFVIFMTDDQRVDAMSCAGNTILPTPNMDRIAGGGVRCLNMFVTNSLCAPSRTTLLTGLYSHTHGVRDNQMKTIKPEQVILPDLLREAGYEVAFCGKSHVDGALRDRKWDYYFGYQGQGIYHNPLIAEGTDGEDETYPGYIDDVVTTKALDWIKGRGDKPFCLFLWFKAPHRAWLRARRHHDLFKNVAIPKPSTYDDDLKGYPGGKPRAFIEATNKIGDDIDVRTLDGFVKDYYSTLVAVDENVGRVLELLADRKIADDTAVMYTSDNGFFAGEWRAYDKRFMHEPSIRVPLLVRYPRMIKPGSTCDKMILNIDIAPTVLDMAGVKVPEWMHGKSALGLFKGEQVEWRKDWLYEYFEYPDKWHNVHKNRGVRTEQYKYIHYYEDPQEYELYDLVNDPEERVNLYGDPKYKDVTEQLRKRLTELRKETGDL